MKKSFPKSFLWGVSTASYQIEGNNVNSDWWEWDQTSPYVKEPAGEACAYWENWSTDHAWLSELGVNAFRLSLEWSRIEPEEGKFSAEALGRYREILTDLKKRNIQTIVTFWHWTSPQWFQKKYGWHKKSAVEIFARYGEEIVKQLGDLIDIAVVINEPMMSLTYGYLKGQFPPGKRNIFLYVKAYSNMVKAYKLAYEKIKFLNPSMPVGITQLYNFVEAYNRFNPFSQLSAWVYKKFWNDGFSKKINKQMDFFGLDYYFHHRINCFWRKNENLKVNDLGWEIYPLGLYAVLKEVNKKYQKPIYIMENGLADSADKYRAEFIKDHVSEMKKAMTEGVEVKGYCYWSLLDNFEWLHGFAPRFGLLAVDYKNQKRTPRSSFGTYRDIIKQNNEL